uniref:Uncharacterized protein n=1 Tax=Macrostomum lignano TaxID=282301 RepID=A0A1I8F762_9PLAT
MRGVSIVGPLWHRRRSLSLAAAPLLRPAPDGSALLTRSRSAP